MKLNFKTITALTVLVTQFGCATGSMMSHTGPGFIYSNHYEADLVTANQAGRKRGQSCTMNIMGLFTSGDASLSAAMKNGGITVVSSVDRYYQSILGIYGKMCVIVTGL
jgi:hypothetical protein